jgi:hypothetical protein
MQCEYSAMPAKLKSKKAEDFGRATSACHEAMGECADGMASEQLFVSIPNIQMNY